MTKRVSLKDIAKKAGVSTATVSYVLSKKEKSGISSDVSEKINKIARQLNYRPNQIAKSLQSGKTFTIGLIVADISNPFFGHLARIIEDGAKKHGFTVIFGSSDENASKSADLIQLLMNRQVDGFIIAPAEDSEKEIKLLKKQNIPFVLIDRFFPKIKTNYVALDNYQAAYEATSRLIETGNKTIGMVAYSSKLQHMKDRIRGYRSALKDNGIAIRQKWIQEIHFSKMEKEIPKAVDDLQSGSEPVKAILFATNTLAIYGLKYFKELRIKVPDDVSVIVFDESDAFDFFYCSMTYIKQPLVEMGNEAVGLLIDQISKPEKTMKQIVLNAELVVRKSCHTNSEHV